MSTIGWVLLWGAAAWLGWAIMIGFADAMLRRDHRMHLETRAWQEKVAAMRRMVDEEGDA
jgi:hypothetical protein